jgi:hypothetical protein
MIMLLITYSILHALLILMILAGFAMKSWARRKSERESNELQYQAELVRFAERQKRRAEREATGAVQPPATST